MWNQPREGAMYHPTTPLCRVPFLRSSMRTTKGRAGSANRTVAANSDNGDGAAFMPVSGRD